MSKIKKHVFISLIFFCAVSFIYSSVALPSLVEGEDFGSIYPVGWSKDGNFCYFDRYSEDPIATDFVFDLVIVSAVTDKILLKKTYKAADDIGILWSKNTEDIDTWLLKYGITENGREFKLDKNLLTYKNAAYTIVINKTPGKIKYQPFEFPETVVEVVTSAKVLISNPSLGSKTIYSYARIKDTDSPVSDLYVVGHFLSPYEPRALILFIKKTISSSGGFYNEQVFTGAHLTNGFKK